MKKTLTTAGIALALGVVWTAGPALAQQTTGEKAEGKMERAKDKAVEAKDTVKEKAVDAKDAVKEKARELKDKVKDKTSDMTDKVKAKTTDKMERKTDRMNAKAEHQDVMAMQQALREKGHNPGPIDGIIGPRTKAALMDYQRKEGLTPSGRWDNETATKLGVRMSAKTPLDPAASVGTTGVPASVPEDKPKMGEKPARPASP